jgi:integrase
VKNLVEVETRFNQVAGAEKENRSIILEYAWQLKKRGLAPTIIKQRVYRLRSLLKHGADLTNPESVTVVLATSNWTEVNKRVYIVAYKSFTKALNLKWTAPKTRVQRKLPFIPTEDELNQLIAGCGKKTATFLQVLKDTAAIGCEAAKIQWTDIDEKKGTITINYPVKGSLSRIVKVP